jgi:hypothetical protein
VSPKLDSEWIIEQLSLLTEHAPELAEVGSEPDTTFRELTVLKLAALSAAIDVYTRIVPSEFDRCYYIDALAGEGVSRLRGTGEYVVGSPIVSPVVAHANFSEYHFIECDPDSVRNLRDRLDWLNRETEVDYPYEDISPH